MRTIASPLADQVNLALTLIGPPWDGRHPDKGIIMRAEMLTAVLALVNPMSLTRRHRNNGNAIVAIDLAEHPDDPLGVAGTLNARIERLEADIAKLQTTAAVHRADFERERERCERLMAEVLKATAELTIVREAVARIVGELAAFQARPWWRRLVTSFSPVLSGAGLDAQNACAAVASGTAS